MKKFSFVLAILAIIVIPFKGTSQFSEAEVKNLISQASEKELVIECSRLLQENFFHYADLITDKLLKINLRVRIINTEKGLLN